jgi:hypothetical protein
VPTDQQIAAREAVIQTQLADYSRCCPVALNPDDGLIHMQAITELTGNPPAPGEPAPEPDTHLDDRYVMIG